MRSQSKQSLIITSLTSCNGCLFASLDLGQKLFDALDKFELIDFHLIEDEEMRKDDRVDITIIEGNVARKEEKVNLQNLRAKSKTLIALGACAHLGSIQAIKNYGDKKEISKYVYPDGKKIDNLKIRPLSSYVKVDFVIPGCPPEKKEILEVLKQLVSPQKPHLPNRPVCYECQTSEYPCLLLSGKSCLGPIIRGGCGAVCLEGGLACTGCRGKTEEPNLKKMKRILTTKEYQRIMEIFGNINPAKSAISQGPRHKK